MSAGVELQEIYPYSVVPLFVTIVLSVVIMIAGHKLLKKLEKKSTKPVPLKKTKEPVTVNETVVHEEIRTKYYKEVDALEWQWRNENISNRQAYQELSVIVRKFVSELTGVKVLHYTLEELKKANMPKVCEVIEECYAPEFSPDKDGDIYCTMNKARTVIKEWHS